jgi:hypothetical protein
MKFFSGLASVLTGSRLTTIDVRGLPQDEHTQSMVDAAKEKALTEQEANDDERDKLINELRTRLQDLEANIVEQEPIPELTGNEDLAELNVALNTLIKAFNNTFSKVTV